MSSDSSTIHDFSIRKSLCDYLKTEYERRLVNRLKLVVNISEVLQEV